MSALVLHNRRVGVKATGVTVTVPNENRAKLMYYLNCMCVVLQLENIGYDLARLTNYQQYYNISAEDEKVLILLCGYLSPDKMEGKCIFLNEEACGNSNNEFFSIKAASTTFAAAESVFVGQVRLAVTQIMCYKLSWMQNNFLTPMQALLQRHTQRSIKSPQYNTSNNYSSSSNDCCCTIL